MVDGTVKLPKKMLENPKDRWCFEYKYAMEVKDAGKKFLIYEFLGKKDRNRTIDPKSVKESKNYSFVDYKYITNF